MHCSDDPAHLAWGLGHSRCSINIKMKGLSVPRTSALPSSLVWFQPCGSPSPPGLSHGVSNSSVQPESRDTLFPFSQQGIQDGCLVFCPFFSLANLRASPPLP